MSPNYLEMFSPRAGNVLTGHEIVFACPCGTITLARDPTLFGRLAAASGGPGDLEFECAGCARQMVVSLAIVEYPPRSGTMCFEIRGFAMRAR